LSKNIIYLFLEINNFILLLSSFWGLGIGDWGLGIGDWAQSPIPNPQSPLLLKIYLAFLIHEKKYNFSFNKLPYLN